MQQAGVAVFVSRVRVFAGGADSGQFSKENSPPHPPKTRHKHGANGSHGHVELGKENVNQISALVLNKPNYKIRLILIKTMSDYCYANK